MVSLDPAYSEVLKKNRVVREVAGNVGGLWGKVFAVGMVSNIMKAQGAMEKLKVTMKSLVSLALPVNALLGIGLFKGMQGAIRSLLHDTGSLEAALERLAHIQGLQRAFAPFMGGLEAAKRKVAELVNFAANSPFQFGDVAAGAKALQVGTRGQTGAKDMKVIGDAAAASGNTFADASSAVTDFFTTVRSGGNIEGVTENLRQMGLISGVVADGLVSMQRSGVDADTVFASLMGTLASARGAMAGMADDVTAVDEAYANAVKTLKVKFAEPFVANDVTNTKNMTAVMISLAPVVSSLASFFQVLTTGFSTAATGIAKWVAGSETATGAVQILIKALGLAAAAVSAISALSLARWLMGTGELIAMVTAKLYAVAGASTVATMAVKVLDLSLRGLAAASSVLIIGAVVTVAAGILLNYTDAMNRATDAMVALDKANLQAQANLRTQIANIKTLTDYQDALTKAIQERTAAQEELNKLDAEWEKKKQAAMKEAGKPVAHGHLIVTPTDKDVAAAGQRVDDEKAEDPTYVVAKGNALKYQRIEGDLIKNGPAKLGGLTTEKQQEAITRASRNAIAAEEEKHQARLAAGDTNRSAIMMDRAKVIAGREDLARKGSTAALQLEKDRAEMATKIAATTKEIEDSQGKGKIASALAKNKLGRQEVEAFQLGLKAPAGTATNLETRIAMMEKAQEAAVARKLGKTDEANRLDQFANADEFRGGDYTPADLMRTKAQLAIEQDREASNDNEGPAKKREAAEAARDERRAALAEQNQLQSAQLRRAGKTEEAVKLDDVSSFTEKYAGLRAQGVSVDDATKRATDLAKEGILESAKPTSTTVADSLQRIGGGGGSYGVDSDAMLQTAKRTTALLDSIAKVVLQFEKVDTGGTAVL